MNRIRRSFFARSFLLPFALTVWLSACHKWVEVEPPQLALQRQADKPVEDRDELRLHVARDSTRYEGDPVHFFGADSVVLAKHDRRVTIPTEEVTRVDVRKFDARATGLVILIPISFGLLIYALSVCDGSEFIC